REDARHLVASAGVEPEPAEHALEVAVRRDRDRVVDRPAQRAPDERRDRRRDAGDRVDAARDLLDVDARVRQGWWHQTVLRSLDSCAAGVPRIDRTSVSAE